jgi:O-antigen/teichoic acid export membrane protein
MHPALDHLHRRTFLVRYLTLFGGEMVSKLCVLGAFAYLARALGPRDLGLVELALSMTVFAVLGAEMGLGSYGARLVETDPARAPQLIARAGLARAILALPTYVVLLVLSSRYGEAGPGILAIYGAVVLLAPFNTQWVFQGLRQMQWVAVGTLVRYGTFGSLVFLLVRPGSDTRIVAAAELAGALAFATFNVIVIVRVLRLRPDWRAAGRGTLALFREAWFLGASDLTWAAIWYSPIVFVGWFDLGEAEHVAWLAAGTRIVLALHTFVWLYFFNLLPNLSRALMDGLEDWRALVQRSLTLSTWLACGLAVGATLLGRPIVTTVFGSAYHEAVLPFRIAIWMIPVAWISGHFRFSLIAAGQQRLEFLASLVAGGTTVFGALLGAAFFGAPGGSAALVAGGAVNALVAYGALRKCVGTLPLGATVPPLVISATAVVAGLLATPRVGELGAAFLAGVFYLAASSRYLHVAEISREWKRFSASFWISRG